MTMLGMTLLNGQIVFVYLYLGICICLFVFVYLYLCICICVFEEGEEDGTSDNVGDDFADWPNGP